MKLSITGSVGTNGTNQAKDVKLIRALLNVYHRQKKHSLLPIVEHSDSALIEAIERFQKVKQGMTTPDGQITSSSSSSFTALINFMKSTRTTTSISKPKKGSLTWDAEGNEGGLFHSRVLHVPSPASGVTIGRGYDMKNRSSSEVEKHLTEAGIKTTSASTISKAAGLSGSAAEQFIIDKDLLDFEISAPSQLKLFELVYKDYVAIVKRICEKKTVVEEYGKTEWDKLDPYILDVVVDLTFRGDYHGTSRKIIQESIADNDFEAFKKLITDKSKWGGWPPNRFARRKEFLDYASKQKRKFDITISKSALEGAKHSQPKMTGTPQ